MHSSSYFPDAGVIYTTAVAHVPARLPARCFVSVCSIPSAPFLGLVVIYRRFGMPLSVPDDATRPLSASAGPTGSAKVARSVEPPGASPAPRSKRRRSSWCSSCHMALWHFEQGWPSSKMCNRCYNKDKKGKVCGECGSGLWMCELEFPSGVCCECRPPECYLCSEELSPVEVRWRNACCDCCWSTRKGSTKRCMWCDVGLRRKEMDSGSTFCSSCR